MGKTDYNADAHAWDSFSDAKLRTWLVKHDVVDANHAAKLKRHQLEALVEQHWYGAKDNLSQAWQFVSRPAVLFEVRQWSLTGKQRVE